MCGIAGILNLSDQEPPSEVLLRRMLAQIRHRGPDQFGVYRDASIGMGNARLSILDLDGGQQPIATPCGRFWIVYNGEVYNYRELRAELESKGHKFGTHTDTEVVLHLYQELGQNCLDQLNGQFALAIWDTQKRELFLARDRLGIRPLYYTLANGVLVFGSEIKVLGCHPGIKYEIDPGSMDQVFTGWSVLPPDTIFKNVQQLPAGSFALIGQGDSDLKVQRYYDLNFGGPISSDPEVALLEQLEQHLVQSTRARLHADVPVGAYLSGGLDSSVIAALIGRESVSQLDTFSISFTDQSFDESSFQRQMAKYLGTDHQVVEASHADIGQVFPEVIWHTEVPLLRTAPAPMYLLSKLVRDQHYKVVLTGEGADELLAGYDIFKEARIRRYWARQPESTMRPRLLQRIYPDLENLTKIGPQYLASFFGDRLSDVDAPDYSHAIRWRNTRRTQRFFSKGLIQAIRKQDCSLEQAVDWPRSFEDWGPLERSQYTEVATFLSPYLLSAQGDRVAMAHSVEGRYPFLDPNVVEFCSRLPSATKLRGLKDKYLLRQLGKKLVPDEIWKRPKKPYRAPIHKSFIHAKTPDYVKELLSEERLGKAGLFNANAVGQLVRKIEAGKAVGETDDMALVGIISTMLIQEQFVENFSTADPLSDNDDVKVCDDPTTETT